jgi:PII-like signaling protein
VSLYYPQAGIRLRITWEDFGTNDPLLKEVTTIECRPKEVTVNFNDYTEADKFSATLDYRDFPFDPRSIRAMGVTIYIDDMKALYQNNQKVNIQGISNNTDSNIVFLGFADEESIELNDNSRTVRFEGRDFTSLLLDAPYISRPLLMTEPIDVIFQNLLRELPATKAITVENRTGAPLPVLAKFAPTTSETSGKRNTRKSENYWSVIQDLASKAGLIAYIELDKLVITKPRALYSKEQAKQFIYGKNLSNLSFKRELGRIKGFNVQVRSLDLRNKEVMEVKIPEEASEEWAKSIGIPLQRIKIEKLDSSGQKTEEEAPFLNFLVPDITNRNQLIAIGEKIFEELSRQQIEGSLQTKEMVVTYGTADNPVEFDITKLRNGTPLLVEIADERQLAQLRREKSVSQRAKALVDIGYDKKLAYVVAVALGKFNAVFYTKSVEFSLSQTSGFQCNIEFVNFIELPKGLGGRQ